jgi:hypothetical protein
MRRTGAPEELHAARDLGPEFLKKLCKELGIDPRRLFPIPRPSQPARGQRTVALSPTVAAKLSIYQAMRARRMTTEDLSRRLGWEAARLRRLLDLRRRSRLEDIEAALEAMGKRLIIEVGNAA